MDDPNVVFKLAFAELASSLGRTPSANECLGIHDAYKDSYSEARDIRIATERANAAAGRPEPEGFSRKPAPQARTMDSVPRESAGKPLSGPDKGDRAEEADSVPPPIANKPEPSERRYTAGRGPGGGVLATCSACGQEWERPLRAGRPASKCESCRG